MNITNCLDCGSPLRGRSDKKFCDDQCRSHYNNQLHLGSQLSQRPVNAILRKNHSILSRQYRGDDTITAKEQLLEMGFNTKYHTHSKVINGQCFDFCYEFGFRLIDNDQILIKKVSDRLFLTN